ncbi:MBL fold metallo-hydrolase [Methanobacterium alcaliphilum]|uniref:MBL fold metallo-hydrolase n=1 Tax=Methanobacterium alcaliphilum TaxID=392018 RepID=UPI00200A71DE|nr:MBL fold metallo-hydrolase [Methanobacterium alcaliphilum]MCK9150532.1 MBL fold metallo-hydrolase [Methanobacterium alcaliphilum]
MIMEMIKSEGIAQNSYFFGSGGEAVVVDPRRDIDIYLNLSQKHGLNIRYIFETHRNEDFTVGSLELAGVSDSEIFHGAHLDFSYGTAVMEGDTFNVGKLELEILETPGHTHESISIALRDKSVSDDVYLIFTGDVLFAGEVGRVDFFGESETPHMAELLYHSIHEKILPHGDNVILCPAHGAGSVCGADIRDQETTTVGYEKKTNPLLQINKEEFIKRKVEETLYTPPYFKQMELNNQYGAPILNRLPYMPPLNAREFSEFIENGAQVVDLRKPTSFGGGHVPETINIWREGFPAFAGYFLNYDDPILIVDDYDQPHQVWRYLIRLGYDNIKGYLRGGFPEWYMAGKDVAHLDMWSVHQLKKSQENGDEMFLLDVRKINDRRRFHIEGSHHIWVGDIPQMIREIPQDKKIVVYCDSGYKSTIAASILKKNGYSNISSVLGSMGAWLKSGYPVVK